MKVKYISIKLPASYENYSDDENGSKILPKIYTKKYLKKQQLRDWLRVISSKKGAYELRYFNIQADDAEGEDELQRLLAAAVQQCASAKQVMKQPADQDSEDNDGDDEGEDAQDTLRDGALLRADEGVDGGRRAVVPFHRAAHPLRLAAHESRLELFNRLEGEG